MFLPIILSEIYLLFILFLFFYGPWNWVIKNETIFSMYIFSVYFSLFFGYLIGIVLETKFFKYKILEKKENSFKNFKKKYFYLLIIVLTISILTIIFRTGSFFISRKDILNQGVLYYNLLSRKPTKIQLYVEYLRILCGPIIFFINIVYFNNFNRLNRKLKILGGFNLFLLPYLSLKLGIDKYMIDFTLIVLISFLIFILKKKIKTLKLLLATSLVLILVFIGFKQFCNRKLSRIVGTTMLIKDDTSDTYSDRNNFLIKNLDEKTKDGVIILTSYLTQGYYGTSLALEEEYSPTYGFGHSMFLLENIKGIHPKIYQNSYLKKIEDKGWVYGYRWAGIYPWIASDITFAGSLIVFYLWGLLLALSFSEMIKRNSFISMGLFYTLIIGIIYFPANNQLFQNPEAFFTTYFFIIVFILKRFFKYTKKYKNNSINYKRNV